MLRAAKWFRSLSLAPTVVIASLGWEAEEARASDAGNDAGASADGRVDAGPKLFLPGTQPLELTQPLRTPDVCDACHGGFAEYAANDTWKGTMMANAARDPLFQAALVVANQDEPGSGDLCLRCHTPRGWLAGRSEPPVIATLEEADFESVDCDFCHRLSPDQNGMSHIGNGQFRVADDFVRRGPIDDAKAPHDWIYSEYHEESRLCGLCHDVSNPLKDGFPIERTYTEWLSSDLAREGVTCQGCHLPAETGPVCGAPNMPERVAHRHDFAGGNYWMPLVLAGEFADIGREAAFRKTAENARAQLERAAVVTLDAPDRAEPGGDLAFTVRVENQTGHKLPTGYPEGRRAWLEVTVTDASDRTLLHSGRYDAASATRIEDEQLRTYEVRMAARGQEGFHFILQDQVLEDSRIPPRGFVVRPDTRPVGRDYPAVSAVDGGQVLAHWDEAPYAAPLDSNVTGPLTVCASLWYQTTSAEYVTALRQANATDGAGERMQTLWERYDRAPPFEMASTCATTVIDRPDGGDAPDARAPADDAGSRADASSDASDDGGIPRSKPRARGGCDCRFAGSSTDTPLRGSSAVWLFLLWTIRSNRKHEK